MSESVNSASPLDIPVRGWISVNDALPSAETPVLIFWNGNIVIGERRWEHPTLEETFNAFWYWDDPTDDGQDWERNEVMHWMPLPEAPNGANNRPTTHGRIPAGEVMRKQFWNFNGKPSEIGWHAALVCYNEQEGVFPMAAYWDGAAWDKLEVVAFGEKRDTKDEAKRLSYENDPEP